MNKENEKIEVINFGSELEKEKYICRNLEKFKKENHPDLWLNLEAHTSGNKEVRGKIREISEEIINKLKTQELTYLDAYITLEYVYRKLKFNSEYTHL